MSVDDIGSLTLRIAQLPGVSGHVELARLPWCTVVCGPNNGGKTRLLRGMIAKGNLERGLCITDEVIEQFAVPFNANSFGGQQFRNTHIPSNGLKAATAVLRGRTYFCPSDIDDFVASATQEYTSNYGALPTQDAALLFNGTFRNLTGAHTVPRVMYLPPKRRLISPSSLVEPDSQVEVDAATMVGQLFALKNAPLDDPKYARFRAIGEVFKRVTGADFDTTLQTGGGSNVYLRFKPPKSREYREANEVGLGYQDALAICYCLTQPDVDVLILEEAENHLHPDIQRKLLQEFCAGKHNKHIVVSTHSSVFLERPEKTKIFVCRSDRTPNVFDTTDSAVALASIGITNLTPLTSGQILLVEGSSDVGAYRVLLDRLQISQRERITLIPLSGDNMIHFPLEIFKEIGMVKAIVDSDPKSAKNRNTFIASCDEHSIPVHKLERYAIDNYFDALGYRTVFPEYAPQIPEKINPKQKIEAQLGFNPKSQLSRVADSVDLLQIESSDVGKALRSFFPGDNPV